MNQHALTLLPGSPGCFVCDNDGSNPRALRLKLYWDAESGTVRIPCRPDESWCGYAQVVHGGLVASLLDEAMAWAVKMRRGWAFTAECSIRYKKAVQPGAEYLVSASVLEDRGRKILAEAQIADPEGEIVARATATFLPVKGRAKPREPQ